MKLQPGTESGIYWYEGEWEGDLPEGEGQVHLDSPWDVNVKGGLYDGEVVTDEGSLSFEEGHAIVSSQQGGVYYVRTTGGEMSVGFYANPETVKVGIAGFDQYYSGLDVPTVKPTALLR
jgi:hypothetical protein